MSTKAFIKAYAISVWRFVLEFFSCSNCKHGLSSLEFLNLNHIVLCPTNNYLIIFVKKIYEEFRNIIFISDFSICFNSSCSKMDEWIIWAILIIAFISLLVFSLVCCPKNGRRGGGIGGGGIDGGGDNGGCDGGGCDGGDGGGGD